jgi:hypothetical protein
MATPPNYGARQETTWLTPREDFCLNQGGALISISVAGNIDAILCQDADAPHKAISSLWPIPWRCYNNYDMGNLSLGGLGRTDNPSDFALALYAKSAGTSQQHISL